jgi:hypothetical protein
MLNGLPDDWIHNNEGGDSWCPYDVVGHYIHGEKTDWIPRAQIILNVTGDKKFVPFDRFAQFKNSEGKTMNELLDTFRELRGKNIEALEAMHITENDLRLTGIHPDFGLVTLKQLLSTWVVHDLNHIYQISRVMSKQYRDAVGPWNAFLRILKD